MLYCISTKIYRKSTVNNIYGLTTVKIDQYTVPILWSQYYRPRPPKNTVNCTVFLHIFLYSVKEKVGDL